MADTCGHTLNWHECELAAGHDGFHGEDPYIWGDKDTVATLIGMRS